MSWIIALLLLLIEIPLFARHVSSTNSNIERIVDWTRHYLFRAGSYLLYYYCAMEQCLID